MVTHEQDIVVEQSLPPGQQLAAERKKQGLTEREVADQLKITLSKLSAIEQDQYDKFPAQIYLKGYLKNYARLLRLSEQQICDSYQEHCGETTTDTEWAPTLEPTSEFQIGKSWFVALVAAIIIILFFIISSLSSSPSNEITDEAAAIFESSDLNSVLSSPDDTALKDQQTISDVLVDSGVQDIEPTTSLVESIEKIELTQSDEASIEPVEILASKITAAELMSLTELKVEQEVPVIEVVSLSDVLNFQFTSQCWIEVRDNNGSLLYSGLENPGSQRQIEGDGPFKVVIGNVSGTVLSLNGESIALQAPANGRALRLQVGS